MKRRTGIIIAALAVLGCSYVGNVEAEVMPDMAEKAYCAEAVAKDIPAQLADTRKALTVACLLGVTAFNNGMSSHDFIAITDGVIENAQKGDDYEKLAATQTATFMAEGYVFARDGGPAE